MAPKSTFLAYLLYFFLGLTGAHRIYATGHVHYLFWYWLACILTFGILPLVDLFYTASMVRRWNWYHVYGPAQRRQVVVIQQGAGQ